MPPSIARALAFDILNRVESEGAYASDLLHAELGGGEDTRRGTIKPEDAALATEITLGVLRWRRLLDFLLGLRLKKPVERLDVPIAIALRMGLYQLRFLQRIPARAAVNESVELVKRARKSSAAGLVNAVLRRAGEQTSVDTAAKQRSGIVGDEQAGDCRVFISDYRLASLVPTDRIATLHSHSTWLVERWLARFGEERTVAMLEANNRAPGLSLVVREPDRRNEVFTGLKSAGLTVQPGALLRDAFAVSGGGVTRTPAFREGLISIQDEASQAVPLLVDAHDGDRVLDLCAAPGGKTAVLAAAAGPSGTIVAADRHAHRLRAMRAQFERLHLDKIQIVELDAEKPLPFGRTFNRILVDAPCSGTGTLARHPEIRWRLRPEQLGAFHRLQVAILRSALDALAPGGRLVYSTCSMEPEENEQVVREVLGERFGTGSAAHSGSPVVPPFRSEAADAYVVDQRDVTLILRETPMAALRRYLAPNVDAASLFDSDGFFRTIPGEQPTDGFFAAILEKKS